ncbi:hypothetical protein CEP10_00080 [Cylindrospermopsis raciborskii S07]|uniref:Uncharacterized protein n=3 Tax=Cylindrospermopsis raciborskii TaxID=77022 RepID=A0A853MJB4_9CYAN|nr:hypothetical protein [Cylindrospermopsis raciborskii]EFA70443.1 conserved hypothetical protein [Cylindrospermopsis raciborskii CS-505]MBA4446425.1 hypothetical protein [Cylindrospermopsis raciborskii CS-506_C]MBA4450659.1 hypothetical protein [Cylindrospermopsis raciborskii CS-506_D]MBA4457266.1 hypothetical protein [Cylindrospermopsis raciborskii CS-506_B]MBA4466637.1 hypothetical protein [Cylindrospermopsis raciborskii CS-506_A]
MTGFSPSTIRRLKKLTQVPCVWEGDRRTLLSPVVSEEFELPAGECILWVDGSEGVIRSMEVIGSVQGREAMVRTLIQAMEHPQGGDKRARPQKILVRDREVQFYLRGILQDLDITVDYSPELPLIDQIFQSFGEAMESYVPPLPPKYAEDLTKKAYKIWEMAPWEFVHPNKIISIEINKWDIEKLYVSIMGSANYTLLFYRSAESLTRFWTDFYQSYEESEDDSLESAFLQQDCLFLTFDSIDEDDEDLDTEDEDDIDIGYLPSSEIEPNFGTIHPLEGLSLILYEEEAQIMYVALESVIRFLRDHKRPLSQKDFPVITRRYRISVPDCDQGNQNVSVNICTMPEIYSQLHGIEDANLVEGDFEQIDQLRDDLIPNGCLLSIGTITWNSLTSLPSTIRHLGGHQIKTKCDTIPFVLVQTSRAKANTIIKNIRDAGDITGICFITVDSHQDGKKFDLSILQTQNEDLFLITEFSRDDESYIASRKRWNRACRLNGGHCGLVITKGLSTTRANPGINDIMAFFDGKCITPEELSIDFSEI